MTRPNQFLYRVLFAAAMCAFLLFSTGTRADSLTGTVGITWLFPDTSTVFGTDTIAVGSALSCPGLDTSPVCAGFGDIGFQTCSVGTSSISYVATDWVDKFCCNRLEGSGTAWLATRLSVKSPFTGMFARLISMNKGPNVTSEALNPGMSVVKVNPPREAPLRNVNPVKSNPLKAPSP
jgi:hypothetical protein